MTAAPQSPFRPDALQSQVALITGGGSGIGFEIARQLGLHGASVVIMGRREPVLQAAVEKLAAEGIRAGFCQGDVRNPESCQRAVQRAVELFGPLTCLVNNAAGNFLAAAENLNTKGFRTVMDIDAVGCFNMSISSFEALKQGYARAGDSLIINITAEFSLPPFFQIHAAAAKNAINSMTRSFALEWADYGIRCNGIAPGPIANTTGFAKLGGMGGEDPKKRVTPDPSLPRALKPGHTWDIGMACVYMCSKAGGFVSGDTSIVDGAFHLRSGIQQRPDGHLAVDRELISELSRSRESEHKNKAVGVAGSRSKL